MSVHLRLCRTSRVNLDDEATLIHVANLCLIFLSCPLIMAAQCSADDEWNPLMERQQTPCHNRWKRPSSPNVKVPETRVTLTTTKRKPCGFRRRRNVPRNLPNSNNLSKEMKRRNYPTNATATLQSRTQLKSLCKLSKFASLVSGPNANGSAGLISSASIHAPNLMDRT